MQQSPRRHPRLAGPSAMRADESVRPAQTSDILAASSVAAEPLVNFLKGPWVINPRDKVTGVLHPPRLPSGPTGVKRIPYHRIYLPAPLDAQARGEMQTRLSPGLQSDPVGALYGYAMEVPANPPGWRRDRHDPLHDDLQGVRQVGRRWLALSGLHRQRETSGGAAPP